MAVSVLAWRYDHANDCNRYGNCTSHPFYERPTLTELEAFPGRLPDGAIALVSVPSDVVTANGLPEEASGSGYHELRGRADGLRAAVGEALHRINRGHMEEGLQILDTAASAYDRA